MAILNKITVGGKLVLELDASPISSGVPAPQGSHAMFNDGGVGRSYLKVGALDTDWLAYQTGSDAPAWVFTEDANLLNTSTALSYFGTKAGDFDVEFRRNNVKFIKFIKDVDTVLKLEIAQDIKLLADKFQFGGFLNIEGGDLVQNISSINTVINPFFGGHTLSTSYTAKLNCVHRVVTLGAVVLPVSAVNTSANYQVSSTYSYVYECIITLQCKVAGVKKYASFIKNIHVSNGIINLTEDRGTYMHPDLAGLTITPVLDVNNRVQLEVNAPFSVTDLDVKSNTMICRHVEETVD